MAPLSTFQLPLQHPGPPAGYGWEQCDISALSTTTAFNSGIDLRDRFLGKRRCVICGNGNGHTLQHCHIIRDSEPEIWHKLKTHRWVPSEAKSEPRHEPRDGLLMCSNHRIAFDSYDFFIRFLPDVRKFVLVNYSEDRYLQPYHGKAIALDTKDRYAPFPALFIVHEMRVRGHHPFHPVDVAILDQNPWQDWITLDDLFDCASGSFKRDAQPEQDINSGSPQPQPQFQPSRTSAVDDLPTSGGRKLALNADVIADILAATWASPSWKACQIEGTSWTGTTEENIQKYVSAIGLENHQASSLTETTLEMISGPETRPLIDPEPEPPTCNNIEDA